MVAQEIIQKYLPQDLREKAKNFTIPEKFLQTRNDIVELVLRSRSMDTDEEKQSWFNLVPLMNEEQINKLEGILTREKQKLQEIEEKYEKKKTEIKEKYIQRWESMGYEKKMNQLKEKEAVHREEDLEDAEELLESI